MTRSSSLPLRGEGVTADRGRYLLAPPALHPSGHVDRFLRSPEDEIATLPQCAYDELVRLAGRDGEVRRRLDAAPDTPIPEGTRNDSSPAGRASSAKAWASGDRRRAARGDARRCRRHSARTRRRRSPPASPLPASANLTYCADFCPAKKRRKRKGPPYFAYLAFFAPRTRGKPRAWRLPRCTGPPDAGRESTAPYSEACTVGALIAELVAFGNAVGRWAWMQVGATPHYLNENALFIGPTATARKARPCGSAYVPSAGRGALGRAHRARFGSGRRRLEVRDSMHGVDDDGNEKLIDEGAEDKRLLIHEDELAHVLAVAAARARPSPRSCARPGTARAGEPTKGRKLLATDAHVSLAAITPDELRRRVPETESRTLLDRFLLVAVARDHLLPEPPPIPVTSRASTWKTCAFLGIRVHGSAGPMRREPEPASVGRRHTGGALHRRHAGGAAARGQGAACVCR